MKKKIFNKFLIDAVLILLIFASGIKIYSRWSFPKISHWNYHELQKIDKNKKEFSFIAFSDNKNSVKTFRKLIEKVNAETALLAIDIGDLVKDGEKEKYRFFINQIKRLKVPLLTVVGNHDISENGRANYYELFGKFYYSFSVGPAYFIVLDDANEKDLDPWQMEWLKEELKKSQSYKYRFIFMHVPLYDPRQGDYEIGHSLQDLAFAKELNKIFDENKVTMLFVSHIHGYYSGLWGKTPYLITAGGGAELRGSEPQHDFYHYIKVYVSEPEVKYEVVRIKTPEFELLDRLIHNGWIYLYAFVVIHFFDSIIILASLYLVIYIVFHKKEWLILSLGKKKKQG